MVNTQNPLQTVREYEKQQEKTYCTQDRPLFHLTPMVGWMNDPNGFCWYRGIYHLFYQYYPYQTVWGPMHWGHAVSTDLLHWTYQPAAIAPDTFADAGGCFSGTALPTEDGQLMLLYTGVQPAATDRKGKQMQCLAIGDGTDFVKYPGNPVIPESLLPEGYSAIDFRDPKIWREDGKYYCVAASLHETRQGSILLFESEDAVEWHYTTLLAASNNEYGRMWECPDFFALDGKQVLLVSPQEMQATPDGEFHAGYGNVAMVGHYDSKSHAFAADLTQPVDDGLDFYAPQTTLAPDGRRIMAAWMSNWETCKEAPRPSQWFGCMIIPRELTIRNGRLYQAPVRELESSWQDEERLTGLTVQGCTEFPQVRGRLVDIEMTVDIENSPACRRFEVRFAQNERFFTEVRCALSRGELVFDRSHCGSRRDILHTRHIRIAPAEDGKLKLRLILDKNCVELFVNDGERALSALIETPLEADGIQFRSDGPVRLEITKHTLG